VGFDTLLELFECCNLTRCLCFSALYEVETFLCRFPPKNWARLASCYNY